MAPAPTKAKPKWGIDTSTIAETKATASQASAVSSDAQPSAQARSSNHIWERELYAEERAAAGHSGPGNRDDHRERREAETHHHPEPLRLGRRRLAGDHTADMREDDRREHQRHVFDCEETQARVSHRRAEISHRFGRERAQYEIQKQAEQHLNVERHHQ